MAPEIIRAKEVDPVITKQDVWAIGVIAYEMCTFTLPFTGSNAHEIEKAIRKTAH